MFEERQPTFHRPACSMIILNTMIYSLYYDIRDSHTMIQGSKTQRCKKAPVLYPSDPCIIISVKRKIINISPWKNCFVIRGYQVFRLTKICYSKYDMSRKLFGRKPGETLLLPGDGKRGIAIPPKGTYAELFAAAFEGKEDGDNS